MDFSSMTCYAAIQFVSCQVWPHIRLLFLLPWLFDRGIAGGEGLFVAVGWFSWLALKS
jgi:hypothetical protein